MLSKIVPHAFIYRDIFPQLVNVSKTFFHHSFEIYMTLASLLLLSRISLGTKCRIPMIMSTSKLDKAFAMALLHTSSCTSESRGLRATEINTMPQKARHYPPLKKTCNSISFLHKDHNHQFDLQCYHKHHCQKIS